MPNTLLLENLRKSLIKQLFIFPQYAEQSELLQSHKNAFELFIFHASGPIHSSKSTLPFPFLVSQKSDNGKEKVQNRAIGKKT